MTQENRIERVEPRRHGASLSPADRDEIASSLWPTA